MRITHEGKTYEVLTLDRIGEITHAKLAGGKVMKAECVKLLDESSCVTMPTENGEFYFDDLSDLAEWGIQPLRLVPKEVVTFEAMAVRPIGAGQVLIVCPVEADCKWFRCVEIVEEA